jgi:hypothetical protein
MMILSSMTPTRLILGTFPVFSSLPINLPITKGLAASSALLYSTLLTKSKTNEVPRRCWEEQVRTKSIHWQNWQRMQPGCWSFWEEFSGQGGNTTRAYFLVSHHQVAGSVSWEINTKVWDD